ncbi:MAG: hypothetical protein PHV68_01320 [Candidatus Gastranaerophilales bacterium]|nr:hypothetical protein [Candidatus Gastranaerophilales bacterium]
MKKLFLIITIFIVSTVFSSVVFSQDEDSWEQYMNDYDSNQIQNPVTQKEFDEAYNYMKSKQKKKKDKSDKTQQEAENIIKYNFLSTGSPLVRIPYNLCFGDKKINAGFYSLMLNFDKNNYFVSLYQTEQNSLELQVFPVAHSNGKSYGLVKKYSNDLALFEFQNQQYKFQTYLPFCK